MIYASIQPIDRVAFEIGSIPIYWYGILIGVGALLGYILASYEAKKRGLPDDIFADLLIFAIPISIICARLYYVIFEWEYYAGDWGSIFAVWEGGLAIYSGLIGAVLTGIIFSKIKRVSFWKLADIAAPSLILGQAIGRWGNFINQEAYGGEVSRSFLGGLHLPEFIINQMYIGDAYYHPTFLYESLWNMAGFLLLLGLRRVNLRRGELFLTYVIWYSFGRFFIEGLRTDSLMLFDTIRVAQLISVLLIVVAVSLILYRKRSGLSKTRYLDNEEIRS